MAGATSDYHHGDQDIHAQQATFRAVLTATKWSCLALAAGILFLTLWFCTAAGFVNAFVSAAVVVAIGIVFLRRPPAH